MCTDHRLYSFQVSYDIQKCTHAAKNVQRKARLSDSYWTILEPWLDFCKLCLYSFLPLQTGCGAHQASCSSEEIGRGAKLNAYIHLVPSLRTPETMASFACISSCRNFLFRQTKLQIFPIPGTQMFIDQR
jgi:hypothetical protein